MWSLLLLLVAAIATVTNGAPNLLQDGDFEEQKYPTNHWYCNGNCQMTPSTDKVSGHQSLKFSGRKDWWEGPSQQVPLKRNTRYHVIFCIKQLNNQQGKVFQRFKIMGQYKINSAKSLFPDIAIDQNVHTGRGWVKLEAFMITPDEAFITARVVVAGPEPSIDYLVDGGTVTLLSEDTKWKSEANKRIDQYRKNDINFNINIPSNTNPHDYIVEIKLNKHLYPFGSMINTKHVIDSQYQRQTDLYYYMFNFATLADYYWKWSKGPYDKPYYTDNAKAIKELHKRGIPVRGHNIFWGSKDNKYTPDIVMKMNSNELKNAVDERIRYIVSQTKGLVDHWDVSNEMLHNHYFEEKTGDPYYSHHMYKYLHQLDPKPKLFLNDYNIIPQGTFTSAFVNQANEYKKANVGVYGLGVQCHFPEYEKPDATLIRKRLDQMATTGLPLWVTELDVVVADENTRADWYDITLRTLFSHPAVEGIILWDFYGPQHWRGPNAGLVSGPDYRVNPAGKHYLDLIYQEWSTHIIHNLGNGKVFSVRGFHGDYEVIVKYKGSPIKDQKFTLSKSDKHVDITVTDIHAHPNIVTTKAPNLNENGGNTGTHTGNSQYIHTGEYNIGSATSEQSPFTCTTHWSGFSEIGDDKHVDAYCPKGYILTGCTSESKSPSEKKDGESIETNNGIFCRAWNGAGANSPVQAAARCCKRTGLSCTYRRSHPSPNIQNAKVETRCPAKMYALGCSVHNFMHDLAGAYSLTTSCLSQNHGDHKGVEPYAVCCTAPNLHCVNVKSKPTGLSVGSQVKLKCESGYQMTSCHGFSPDQGLSSTFIYNDECTTINGAQKQSFQQGVTAHATCCK